MSETLALRIKGMTCASCARHVEEALAKVPGVRQANVSYPEGTAQVSDCADECAAPVTEKRTGLLRQAGGYCLTVLAVLACPCHLPVLLLLLGGTVAGTFLADHLGTFVAVASIVFLLSLIGALHFLTSDRGNS